MPYRPCRSRYSVILPLCGALLLGVPLAAHADSADPAAARITHLDEALLDAMKQADQLGVQGRYSKLAPVLSKTYDLPTMSRLAVGSSWSSLQPAQQTAIVNAFSKMMTATYASRFDGFSGEQFQVVQVADQPNGTKFVKTHIVQSDGKTVALNYLMRKSGNDWRVIDVYLDGTISELASRRAEFVSILRSGGPDALVTSLNRQSQKLLAGS